MEFKHKSVLLEETIEGLDIKPDGIYVDGTLGGAGHAGEVCRKLSAKGRFIGIDQDQDAIIAASERLAPYKQATIIRSNYCYMVQELAARGIYKVDGILLDLGVSSYQLDNEERRFYLQGRCTARYAHGSAPDADSRRYCTMAIEEKRIIPYYS